LSAAVTGDAKRGFPEADVFCKTIDPKLSNICRWLFFKRRTIKTAMFLPSAITTKPRA
jgi:hypothetical protein